MLLQQIRFQNRISSDKVVAKESHHFFIRHRGDFWSAIDGVVELRNAWNINLVVEDEGFKPLKILRAFVFIEMRDRRPGWRKGRHPSNSRQRAASCSGLFEKESSVASFKALCILSCARSIFISWMTLSKICE